MFNKIAKGKKYFEKELDCYMNDHVTILTAYKKMFEC